MIKLNNVNVIIIIIIIIIIIMIIIMWLVATRGSSSVEKKLNNVCNVATCSTIYRFLTGQDIPNNNNVPLHGNM